ncbi:MAG: chemotaxis protein CheV [Candidatus Delongbacteria bacterium]|nr:chemotaxis protein CheV [Candidatus Delongbacteria bacterium]MBN2833798.1 chemotaxis protein CheV [Candidatus Delongbacteria bacterium]
MTIQYNTKVSSNTEDELIRLVSSNADASSQYVIFRNGSDDLYAINVAKVEELIVYKHLDIARNSNPNALTIGVTKFRDNMITLVNFDRWLGKNLKEDKEYELVMVCNYGSHMLGMVIKNVVKLMSIDPSDLTDNSDKDDKMSFITEIMIDNKKQLCLIFDSDKLLIEVFPDIEEKKINDMKKVQVEKFEKKLLVAEDSKIIQKTMKLLLDKMEMNYEMFSNGKDLLKYTHENDPDEVGLIITDIEMPVMDGITLIKKLKEDKKTSFLPVVVNTNMANSAVVTDVMKNGAVHIIKKLDLNDIKTAIQKFFRK